MYAFHLFFHRKLAAVFVVLLGLDLILPMPETVMEAVVAAVVVWAGFTAGIHSLSLLDNGFLAIGRAIHDALGGRWIYLAFFANSSSLIFLAGLLACLPLAEDTTDIMAMLLAAWFYAVPLVISLVSVRFYRASVERS